MEKEQSKTSTAIRLLGSGIALILGVLLSFLQYAVKLTYNYGILAVVLRGEGFMG